MDDYVAVTLTGEFVQAKFGGDQRYNRVALLYLGKKEKKFLYYLTVLD